MRNPSTRHALSSADALAHLDDARQWAVACDEPMLQHEQRHLQSCITCASDLAAFRAIRSAALVVASPTALEAARAQRTLMARIDVSASARVSPWAAAALAVASGVLSAAAAWMFLARAPDADDLGAHTVVPRDAATALRAAPASQSIGAPAAIAAQPLKASAKVHALPSSLLARAARFVRDDQPELAAQALMRALASGEAALEPLAQLLRDSPGTFTTVAPALKTEGSAGSLRLRCERALLLWRDRAAVDACEDFELAFPDDAAVRTLAFAAGRLAEDALADFALAEAHYDRAVVLSRFSGDPAVDALLARARVRLVMGERDKARGDLRVVLARDPTLDARDDVQALLQQLAR